MQVSADSLRGNLQLGFLTPAASEQLAQELRTTRGMSSSTGSDNGYSQEGLEDRQTGSSRDYVVTRTQNRFQVSTSESRTAMAHVRDDLMDQ